MLVLTLILMVVGGRTVGAGTVGWAGTGADNRLRYDRRCCAIRSTLNPFAAKKNYGFDCNFATFYRLLTALLLVPFLLFVLCDICR